MRAVRQTGVGIALLAAAALAGAPTLVGAQVSGSSTLYNLSASASGVHVIVAMPNFVVVDRFIDGGGPTAQANLSALEGPSSYAAQPYPGDIAIAFPGLLKVVGFPLDVPPYPFYVNASGTKPEGKLSQPGYELSATAAPTDAAASARSGQASDQAVVGHAVSTARTWLDGATYRAEAVSSGDLFQLGPLRLAGMRAKATASVPAAGGTTTLGSHLEVTAASVKDVPVTFSPEGVKLAGSNVPLPKDNPITKGLSEAGLSVEYLSASTTQDTVVSPGLRIRATQTFPGIDKQLQVTYLIGQAVAHGAVSTVAGDGVLPTPDLPLTGGVTGAEPPAAAGDTTSGSDSGFGALPTASGSGTSGGSSGRVAIGGGSANSPSASTGSVPAPEGSTAEQIAADPPAGEAAAGGEAALTVSELDLQTTSSTESIYLVVVAAALLAALALHALRQLGVRAPARIGVGS
jgi:hypothetical protein